MWSNSVDRYRVRLLCLASNRTSLKMEKNILVEICHSATFITWRYCRYKHRNPVFCDMTLFRWASSSRRFEGTESAPHASRPGSPTTLLRKLEILQIQCGLVQNNNFSPSLEANISQTFTMLEHARHVNLSTQSKLQKYKNTSLWL